MRLAVAEREVDVVGLDNGKPFRIEATGKAFRVLSSNLYRDKIGAVVREIGTNGRDEHIKLGKPELPFSVHLPNAMEPFFSVRDYGPGISPEDMDAVYTVYFHSTKTHSNRYTGALGLGSKSPFAYTESFTVVSHQSGTKRTYVVYMNKDGVPTYDLMNEAPTDEPDGLEVSVPVARTYDFQTFADRAADIYSRFTPRPTVTGHRGFVFRERRVIINGKGWKLVDGSGPLAVMGPIAYRVSPCDIHGGYPVELTALLGASIEVDFPMGSLDISPGREDLSYDPQTSQTLVKRFKQIHGELVAEVQAKFDACTTVLAAKGLHGELFSHRSRGLGSLVAHHTFTFRGKPISTNMVTVDVEGHYPNLTIVSYMDSSRRHRGKTHCRKTLIAQNGEQRPIAAEDIEMVIWPETEVTVLHNDLSGRGMGGRIRLRRANKPQEALLVVTGDEADYRRLLAELEGATGGKTSDLPKPERPRGTSPSGARGKRIYLLDNHHSEHVLDLGWRSSTNWVAEDADAHSDACFYIPLNSGRGPDDAVPKTLGRMMVLAKNLDILPLPIYGLTPLWSRKAQKPGSGWTAVWDEITERGLALLTSPDVVAAFEHEERLAKLGAAFSSVATHRADLRRVVELLDKDHPLSRFHADTIAPKAVPNMPKLRELAMLLCHTLPSATSDFCDRWRALDARYPLLTPLLSSGALSTTIFGRMVDATFPQRVADYVKMIDTTQPVPV